MKVLSISTSTTQEVILRNWRSGMPNQEVFLMFFNMRIGMVALLVIGVVHSLSLRTSIPSFGGTNDFARNIFALQTNDPGTRTFIACDQQVKSTPSSPFSVGDDDGDWENFGIVLQHFKPASICIWRTML